MLAECVSSSHFYSVTLKYALDIYISITFSTIHKKIPNIIFALHFVGLNLNIIFHYCKGDEFFNVFIKIKILSITSWEFKARNVKNEFFFAHSIFSLFLTKIIQICAHF